MIKGQNEPLVREQHFCLCRFRLQFAEKIENKKTFFEFNSTTCIVALCKV